MTFSCMDKKETNKQSDQDTLAEVTKEMAKPRVAMSARKQLHILRNDLVVKDK
jgi:hypothetical protein